MRSRNFRPMTRTDLARIMGGSYRTADDDRVDATHHWEETKPGDNRIAWEKSEAPRADLIVCFQQCAHHIRAIGNEDDGSAGDLLHAMQTNVPMVPNHEETYDDAGNIVGEESFDPEGVLNDLAIYIRAYQKIEDELRMRDAMESKAERREARALKRRASLKVVAPSGITEQVLVEAGFEKL